jgi:DNA repair exonuclease SbcCD nuclease subunit
MIKILHSADWHLDSPLQGHTPEQTVRLRQALLQLPGKIAALCRTHNCDLLLLSGDLFDGRCSEESYRTVYDALEEAGIPVFISPGNHDPLGAESPWQTRLWPANVHIFTKNQPDSVAVPHLDCRVYGAGFTGMDCPGLLEGFRAEQLERYAIGVFHGDPTQVSSHYCPITAQQVKDSQLDYLALGHIHKGDSFRQGNTLCAWPGCPMGRGYDEGGEKGVLLVTVDDTAQAQFIPLNTPRFHDLQVVAGDDPMQTLGGVLPAIGNEDFYRITFTGTSAGLDLISLQQQLPQFPNLILRDRTTAPVDIWGSADADTFERMYFKLLKDAMDTPDQQTRETVLLAAKLSRQILDGQEVVLP